MNIETHCQEISQKLGLPCHIEQGLIFITAQPDQLINALTVLKSDPALQFSMLTDLSAIDYPGRTKRFEVIYNLLSLTQNHRIIIKVSLEEEQQLPSITNSYSVAGWYEREVWDMFGIIFSGNKDLRRILTDYGFQGHPLRKDFPLTGYVEVRYDNEQQKVIYEPVKLPQEFRKFDFLSPWEGTDYILPGDEKAKIG